jgi:hypothetical protein
LPALVEGGPQPRFAKGVSSLPLPPRRGPPQARRHGERAVISASPTALRFVPRLSRDAWTKNGLGPVALYLRAKRIEGRSGGASAATAICRAACAQGEGEARRANY